MGGYDPYSASKGCSELITSSYRNSFFNIEDYKIKHNILIASCRAGNVIGGGDWAVDRLIPDIIRSVAKNEKVKIRNPYATRPWQHVLEPLSGYLQIGEKLLKEKKQFSDSWNFGPNDEGAINVEKVVKNIKKYWDKIKYELNPKADNLHEANLLKLDCSKSHSKLRWTSIWNSDETFNRTINWYKNFYENSTLNTIKDMEKYIKEAKKQKVEWTN
jgi:CDP-glucose 4,6-dehydratase